MKKLILIFLINISMLCAQGQRAGFIGYYYKGEKVYYPLSEKRWIAGLSDNVSFEEQKAAIAKSIGVPVDSLEEVIPNKQFLIKPGIGVVIDKMSVAKILHQFPLIQYIRPVFVSEAGNDNSYGSDFIVKLKSTTRYKQLSQLAEVTGCTQIKKYPFLDNIYIISAGEKGHFDGLTMANHFYETGLFEYAEPDKIVYGALHTTIPNDSLYHLQWGHRNNGSVGIGAIPGADIKVPEAWTITRGQPYIKIGVIDQGVDLTHPDLQPNLLQGFNAATLTANAGDGAPLSANAAHGTNCAGIIAAVEDNTIGIAGIAPRCKIIPAVIFGSTGSYLGDAAVAASFDYVRLAGADIISNSWGGGSVSSMIDDAIERAVTLGRNGKGCLVFFSSGNNSVNSLVYPANHSKVISVGAVNMCGERKARNTSACDGESFWGSNYGVGLSLVAPGVKIASTDIQGMNGYNNAVGSTGDYLTTFNGTSAACPHAAAVAALILSVDSALTANEVTNILAASCDKLAPYPYNTTLHQPYGTWSFETGYGRVNAYNAVIMAQTGNHCSVGISAPSTLLCNNSIQISVQNPLPNSIYQWKRDNVDIGTGQYMSANRPGNYSVVINKNGCTATSNSIALTDAADFSATASPNAVCPGGSSVITANPSSPPLVYCTPTYVNGTGDGDYISHVSIAGTSFSNTTTGAYYPYYTLYPLAGNTTAQLSAGNTYTMTVKGGTYDYCYINAWIDYNQDGIFDPLTEALGASGNVGAFTAGSISFTIPSGAFNGPTRLRLRSSDTDPGPSNAMACNGSNSGYGESEDYIITIISGIPKFTYLWQESGSGYTLQSYTLGQVTASQIKQNTTYTVTVTHGAGCSQTREIEVISKAAGIGNISAAQNPVCGLKKFTSLTATGIKGENVNIDWYSGSYISNTLLGTGNTFNMAFPGNTYFAIVKGGCGDSAIHSIKIISDTIKPVINCPGNSTLFNAGACSITLQPPAPSFSDNCTMKSLVWNMSGATTASSASTGFRTIGNRAFNNGITTITYTARDSNNNTKNCSFKIKVVDIVKPSFTAIPANITDSLQTGCNKIINLSPLTFSDNCGIPLLTWTFSGATISAGQGQPGNQIFNTGTTNITYTITDGAGNQTYAYRWVQIADRTKPNLICPNNIVAQITDSFCSKPVFNPAPAFSDNCSLKSLTWSLSGATVAASASSGIRLVNTKTFNAGITKVTYKAKDISNNTKYCSYQVQLHSLSNCLLNNSRSTIMIEANLLSAITLNISPNPARTTFSITNSTPYNDNLTLKIFNQQGQLINILSLYPNQTKLIGEKLLPGLYYFELIQGKNRVINKAIKL